MMQLRGAQCVRRRAPLISDDIYAACHYVPGGKDALRCRDAATPRRANTERYYFIDKEALCAADTAAIYASTVLWRYVTRVSIAPSSSRCGK